MAEDLYRALLDALDDLVLVVGRDGRILDANDAACCCLGYGLPELQELTPEAFDQSEHGARAGEYMREVHQAGSKTFETVLTCRDGRAVPVEVRASRFDLRGNGAILAVCHDLSERKRLEQELRSSEALFRHLVQSSQDIVVMIDADGVQRFISPAVEAITGFRPEELNIPVTEICHPDDVPLIQAAWRRCISVPGALERLEYRHSRKGGGYVELEVIAVNCLDDPDLHAVVCTTRDVSERKRSEMAQRQKDFVFNEGLTANSIADRDGVITEANRAFLKVWGYPDRNAVIGRKIPEFLAYPHEAEAILAALTRDGKWSGLYTARRQDGSPFTAYGLATTVRDERGELIGYQSAVQDFTERIQAERDLAAAKAAAEAANRAKSEFLANISHEIRTPLNGVIGMINLLRSHGVDDTQRQYLEIMESSSVNLLAVINDVLDLSQIEAGRIELRPVEFSLRRCVSESVRTYLAGLREKGLEVCVEIPPELPDVLVGDEQRFRQILHNLISNALKFTERGGITIVAALEEGQGGRNFAFRISDTGRGIPPEQMERIFLPFEQGDASLARQHGGTGLGLAVCRKLAALMGGELSAESVPGVGSTFLLRLPMEIAQLWAAPQVPDAVSDTGPARPEEPLAILLAEDNAVNALYAGELLRELGHSVTVVRNGLDAVAAWESGGFDLILMDVQMPGMDGATAVRVIREREGLAGHIPIVAMTAYAFRSERENLLETGFDGYIAKPFGPQEVVSALLQHAPRGRNGAT